MKNTIKNLISAVKKALTTRSSLPENISNAAYIDRDGNAIARSFNKQNEADHEIIIFCAGIVDDISRREMLYSKDALTLAANTGIFAGGYPLPEAYQDFYNTPDESFTEAVKVSFDDLKAAAAAVSSDKTRPVLTCVNITPAGIIQACDGFRAYRKQGEAVNAAALDEYEADKGLAIPGVVMSYGFKGVVNISLSKHYYRIADNNGLTIYARKPANLQFINLDSVYQGRGSYKRLNNTFTATIKDLKTFEGVLKAAIKAGGSDRSRAGIALKTRKGFIDYYIRALDVFGSIEADTEATPAGYNAVYNPKYLFDAIYNQGYSSLEINTESAAAPLYISDKENPNNSALLLPIRDTDYYFTDYDRQNAEATKQAEAPAKRELFTVPAALAGDPTEAEAIARINARQNAANRYENISRDDVKREIETMKQEAESATTEAEAPAADPGKESEATEAAAPDVKQEAPAPEIVKAREIYKRLIACNFKPTEIQEAEAEIIYRNNREKLAPIAKKAGALYIDTLSIIAATMAVFSDL